MTLLQNNQYVLNNRLMVFVEDILYSNTIIMQTELLKKVVEYSRNMLYNISINTFCWKAKTLQKDYRFIDSKSRIGTWQNSLYMSRMEYAKQLLINADLSAKIINVKGEEYGTQGHIQKE